MTNKAEILFKRYHELPIDEQKVLIIMAVAYEPLGQNLLSNITTELGFRTNKGVFLSTIIAKPLRDKLTQLGLNTGVNGTYRCPTQIINKLSRLALKTQLYEPISLAITNQLQGHGYRSNIDYHFVTDRMMRDFLYLKQTDKIYQFLDFKPFKLDHPGRSDNLISLCLSDFDQNWFFQLDQGIIFQVLFLVLNDSLMDMTDSEESLEILEKYCQLNDLPQQTKPSIRIEFFSLLAQQLILRGRINQARKYLSQDFLKLNNLSAQYYWPHALTAIDAFLTGRNDLALDKFDYAIQLKKKQTRKRKQALHNIEGFFHIFALIKAQTPAHLAEAKNLLTITKNARANDYFEPCIELFEALLEFLNNGKFSQEFLNKTGYLAANIHHLQKGPFFTLLVQLIWHWADQKPHQQFMPGLRLWMNRANESGFLWYAHEAGLLLDSQDETGKNGKGIISNIALNYKKQNISIDPLLNLIKHIPQWERSLKALQKVGLPQVDTDSTDTKANANHRLAWLLDPDLLELAPKEQKQKKNGTWGKGRAIALKRLLNDRQNFSYLSEQDLAICDCIIEYSEYGGWSSHITYKYELSEKALNLAVEHPYLFISSAPEQNISLTQSAPNLIVKKDNNSLHLSLVPFPENESAKQQLSFMGSNLWQLTEFDEQHLQIADILSSTGITVPLSAKQQVLASLSAIAPLLTVHSDIGGNEDGAMQVESDLRLYVHLQPDGEGLKLQYLIFPFGATGPGFKPGDGGKIIFAEIDGKRLQTNRDLKNEIALVDRLSSACPALQHHESSEVTLGEPQQALEALEYLQANQKNIVLAWPKGQSLNLSPKVGMSAMQVRVGGQQQDWFEIEGKLKINDDEVLELSNLLQLLEQSPGRFLKINDNQYISLSQQLHQRLSALSSIANKNRLHTLASASFDEYTDGMQVQQSSAWTKQRDLLHQAYELEVTVPTTLQAQLREYQLDGFRWLSQLAHWGAGACLADDMGLGKTIQALGLILTRASQGPTLILAPTSVCINWLAEVERFAPSLNLHQFGIGDRRKMLENAGPNDLIVCSYGLLQNEIDTLTEVSFSTIVADEAQALKNSLSKRSKAALRLKGDFKIITTGTPIENHLGELWALFTFINPGLLGSLEEFNQQYANPIESEGDVQSIQRLRTLIKPFILRRLKSEVLTELPARTDITLTVEPSKEESIFYESIRRQALKRIDDAEGKGAAGQKKIRVLAEIMRLRRACCHPRLVMPESTINSAKLKAFINIIDDLRENNHRALVFSQFVGHLHLLREYLEEHQIPYQYLDGSTSSKKRQQAVSSFQEGSAELFLISLKAGGAGLNLTAADYVIHMDPWWNPAVEDQASDRAHRIGQTRPVTVYRVIMKNSIEEKILSLHHKKRDLADSLLEGSGKINGKLALDEMLALLNDTK